jgi:hypothetical protein
MIPGSSAVTAGDTAPRRTLPDRLSLVAEPDLAPIVGPGLDVVNLPMVESAADILACIAVLERAEST